ncbi:MAG: diguanylate cyclase [Clostridiales bacterium]|nr:diguanylate cyclase [Clostridiales bacterium]
MRFIRNLEIWQALVFPITIIIIITSFSVYTQSTDYGYKVLDSTVNELQHNNKIELFSVLDKYLEEAVAVNKFNASLAKSGLIDLNAPLELGQYFLEQAKSNSNIDFAYYANEAGGITSSGLSGNETRLSFTLDMKKGPFLVHTTDDGGELILLRTVEDFDVHTKDWYTQADQLGEVYWTDVYGGAQDPVLAVSTSYPYFDELGNKLGVFGADILLDEITSTFKTLPVSENTRLYLFESDGNLIVDTGTEQPFLTEDGVQIRKTPFNSDDAMFKTLFENIQPGEWLNRQTIDNTDYYLGVYRYAINEEKSWYLGIAIPESDYSAGLNLLSGQLKETFVISLILLIVVLFLFVRWISKPLGRIASEIDVLSKGNFGQQITVQRTDAIGKLIHSFNDMSTTLSTMVQTIHQKNEELASLNKNLEHKVRERTLELEQMATTDLLTNLINRRELLRLFEHEMSVYKRYKNNLSVAILDIDHFKKVNDTYGHLEGDNVLIGVAQTLKACVRESDIVGRYGGEEFLIIMPQTATEDAHGIIERCRTSVEDLITGESEIKVTISAGIAAVKDDSVESTIVLADDNLYKAKLSGRNRIV